MLRKIMILGLILLTLFVFYKVFMADTLEPFFIKHSGNVDILQLKVRDYQFYEK